MTDGESTPSGGAKADGSSRKARKTASRTPVPRGPKRSSTVVMEHPEIAPASPAPPHKARPKTSNPPAAKRRATMKMTVMRQAKSETSGPMADGVPPSVADDDDDDVPTRSKSLDWANPCLEEALLGAAELQADQDSPPPPSADETLVDLVPLSDDDFTFSSDDEGRLDDEGEADPMGQMPTQKELAALAERPTVTLVNGVNPSQRKKGEVVRVTERHLYVLADGETRRIGRKAGFEHPPGGSWSAWRLAGEDLKLWRMKN